MRKSQLIPAPLPLPTAPATDSQRQALRELAEHVGQLNRSRILTGLASLTYAQATQQIGNYYQQARQVPTSSTRTYVVPDNSLDPGLPQGSLVLLRSVNGNDLLAGDLVLCTDKSERAALLGCVRQVQRGRCFNEHTLTLTQTEAEHTLWANRPYRFWYRVEITSLAC